MKTAQQILTLFAFVFLLYGCETTSISQDKDVTLSKGMTTGQIVTELGDPLKVIPVNIVEGRGDAWIYEKIITTTSQIASHTIDIEYVDPITSVRRIIKEPVHELQSTKHKFLTTLYVLDGKLIGWKQTSTTNNSINN